MKEAEPKKNEETKKQGPAPFAPKPVMLAAEWGAEFPYFCTAIRPRKQHRE